MDKNSYSKDPTGIHQSGRPVTLTIQVEKEVDMRMLKTAFEDSRSSLVRAFVMMNLTDRGIPLKTFINGLEESLINYALSVTRGNLKNAASMLRVKPTTLFEKVKKYHIKKPKIEDTTLHCIKFDKMDPFLFHDM